MKKVDRYPLTIPQRATSKLRTEMKQRITYALFNRAIDKAMDRMVKGRGRSAAQYTGKVTFSQRVERQP
ncbi:hypothetical protein Peetri_00180 [Pseudomonas phage vB_PpuM-Peetri]